MPPRSTQGSRTNLCIGTSSAKLVSLPLEAWRQTKLRDCPEFLEAFHPADSVEGRSASRHLGFRFHMLVASESAQIQIIPKGIQLTSAVSELCWGLCAVPEPYGSSKQSGSKGNAGASHRVVRCYLLYMYRNSILVGLIQWSQRPDSGI